jgi:predicted transcriptional regulator
MAKTSERRADPAATVVTGPALRVLEAALRTKSGLTRQAAAKANRSGLTTADDYLRALAKLGFLERTQPRPAIYRLTDSGRALVERRPP